jgi:hypothetical protein
LKVERKKHGHEGKKEKTLGAAKVKVGWHKRP